MFERVRKADSASPKISWCHAPWTELEKSGGSECHAHPAAPQEQEEKRTLGLTIVCGTNIIALTAESPPPADPSARLGTSAPGGAQASTMQAGPGISTGRKRKGT